MQYKDWWPLGAQNTYMSFEYMIFFFYSPPPPPHPPTPPPRLPLPTTDAVLWCVFCGCRDRFVFVLWDWELMHSQTYVYIIFVYHVVYVDMSIPSSQINHLNLESCWFQNRCGPLFWTSVWVDGRHSIGGRFITSFSCVFSGDLMTNWCYYPGNEQRCL